MTPSELLKAAEYVRDRKGYLRCSESGEADDFLYDWQFVDAAKKLAAAFLSVKPSKPEPNPWLEKLKSMQIP